MQEQAVASVRRPKPVDGMTPATAGANGCSIPRSSPRTTSSTTKGNLIAARGTRVNPLDMVQLSQDAGLRRRRQCRPKSTGRVKPGAMLGQDHLRLGLAVRRDEALAAPASISTRAARSSGKFGIRHTPAVVSAGGSNLKISEFPLPPVASAPAPTLIGGGKAS
jgi:conjugal transfer pilus assembly protein TraW